MAEHSPQNEDMSNLAAEPQRCRNHDSPGIDQARQGLAARLLALTGLENHPFLLCTSKSGTIAHQCPSFHFQHSTNGTCPGFKMRGAKQELKCGYPGTASLFPKEASWSGILDEADHREGAQGVIMIEGVDGCVEGIRTGWSDYVWQG